MKILFNFMKLSKHHIEILKTAESWINEIGYKVKTRDNGNVRSWIFDEGENSEGRKPFSISVVVDSKKDSDFIGVEMEDGSEVSQHIDDKIKKEMFMFEPSEEEEHEQHEESEDDDDESSEEDQKNMLYDAIIRDTTNSYEQREEYDRQEQENYNELKKEIIVKLDKIKRSKVASEKKINKIISLLLEYWDDDDITKIVKTIIGR